MDPLDRDQPLAAVQRYVAEMELERGFADRTVVEQCLHLGEEVGELFQAVRRSLGIAAEPRSETSSVAAELADVLIFVCGIANRLDVDLEEAFRAKEASNQQRSWGPPTSLAPGDPDPSELA